MEYRHYETDFDQSRTTLSDRMWSRNEPTAPAFASWRRSTSAGDIGIASIVLHSLDERQRPPLTNRDRLTHSARSRPTPAFASSERFLALPNKSHFETPALFLLGMSSPPETSMMKIHDARDQSRKSTPVISPAFKRDALGVTKLRDSSSPAANQQAISSKKNALVISYISIILDIWIRNRPSLP